MQEDLSVVLKKLAGEMAARAVKNPWHPATNWKRVQHRVEVSRETGKPCQCAECETYMAAMEELRSKGEIQ